jgi:hypothetical protein
MGLVPVTLCLKEALAFLLEVLLFPLMAEVFDNLLLIGSEVLLQEP